jgi:hypothetical protein
MLVRNGAEPTRFERDAACGDGRHCEARAWLLSVPGQELLIKAEAVYPARDR